MATDALDLDDLERMLGAATCGPWYLRGVYDEPGQMVDEEIAVMLGGDDEDEGPFDTLLADQGNCHDDRLIVAAVNALPQLIRAARERDALREALEFYADPANWDDDGYGAGTMLQTDDGDRARAALSPGGEPLVGGGGSVSGEGARDGSD